MISLPDDLPDDPVLLKQLLLEALSQIDAQRDIAMVAAGDVTLGSAADEDHYLREGTKVTRQTDHVEQVSSQISAGGSIALSAGKDLNVVASQVNAKDEAYLYAGGDVNLLAAQDSDYSYYSKTKKGSWGNQTMDIVRTQGMIEASKAAQAELTDEQRNMPGANPNASYGDRQKYIAVLQATDAYKKTMTTYGTGGSLQQAAQAVTAAIQGLAGGNIAQALVGASAPYLAETIKQMTKGNEEARIMAHAVLGALTASVQGGNVAAGAAGAALAAGSTETIMKALYGTTDVKELSESQKQTVSAVVTLASGISGGLIGGNSAAAIAAAQAGKNSAENNDMIALPPGLVATGQAAASYGEYAVLHGASAEEMEAGFKAIREGEGFEGPMPGNGLVQAWMVMSAGPMSAMELSAGFAATGLGAAISGGANASYQLTTGEPFSYGDAFTAGVVGGLTQGKGFWVTQGVGLSGSYMGSVIKGEDPTYSLVGTAVGTTIGFKGGPIISEQLKPFAGDSAAQVFGNMAGAGISEVIGDEVKSLGDK